MSMIIISEAKKPGGKIVYVVIVPFASQQRVLSAKSMFWGKVRITVLATSLHL